ncbi:MAG: eukaryotic-like serine/threonine-protein kinase [Verrucomicrobiota bacterium]|jgi:serine/threonine protein kinase/cytochrome c-type biogenesis protein CcmH/NrfG
MGVAQKQLTRCEQCGALLQGDHTDVGCLNCLLVGGLSHLDAECRRFQHYEICLREDGAGLHELGRGAMGVTYRATDLNLGSLVALKVIGGAYSENATACERFKSEARTAAQLRHPNVASVFHFGETATGHCFYAMELVEGETLEERVRRDGPLPVPAALQIVTQVAEALVAAEAHGLVHRDLKPGNIMITAHPASDNGAFAVKVIDFGLAKSVSTGGDDGDQSPVTFSGTPGFASPEQLKGGDAAIDPRSDIYSLGATLWYLLCGRPPSIAEEVEPFSLRQLKEASVPAPLVELLRSMLASERRERPQTARELLIALQRCQQRIEARPRRFKQAAVVLGALAIIALVVGKGGSGRPRPVTGPVVEKSVAVLPFENLSSNEQDAYFTTGVQDEILSDLAKIADLKVISRSSVMKYKSASERNLGEIAKVLGVSHVVEGSVQRAVDRIRITVQLIDARTDHHLWADHYDRKVTDVFAIQSEIAQQIANQLQNKLSPTEKTAITERPTADLKAYELYTEARAIDVWSDWRGAAKSMARQVELLEQATQRDPTFALAWCALAKTHCDLADNLDSVHLELARKAADAAFRLRPDLGEVHRELARYYHFAADFAHAYEELTIALRTLPNDSETFRIAAETNRHRNRWDEALANFQKARELDPRNEEVTYHLGVLYREMRRYEEWENLLKKEIASRSGSDPWSEMALAEIRLDEGNPVAARAILAKVPLDFSPTEEIWDTRFTTALYLRDYDEASRLVAAVPPKFTGGVFRGSPPDRLADGIVARFRGDQSKANAVFTRVREKFDAAWGDKARNHRYFARVASLDAGLGRKQDAIGEARRAVDLMPIATDSVEGPWLVCNLAMVYAWTGEGDLAIEQLEIIAKIPAGPTYGELGFDPIWDSLRGNPRFEKLVTALAPKKTIP